MYSYLRDGTLAKAEKQHSEKQNQNPPFPWPMLKTSIRECGKPTLANAENPLSGMRKTSIRLIEQRLLQRLLQRIRRRPRVRTSEQVLIAPKTKSRRR